MSEEWYKFGYDSWDEGTHDLSLEEEAAYLRVCNQIYRRKGPIPNSKKLLCSLWRCHPNRADRLLESLLAKNKITLTDDGEITNERAEKELTTRRNLSTLRGVSGRLGGMHSGVSRGVSGSDPKKNPKNINGRDKHLLTASEAEEKRVEESTLPKEGSGAEAPLLFPVPERQKAPDARVFERMREVVGNIKEAGRMTRELIDVRHGNLALAMAAIETASTKDRPREYLYRLISAAKNDKRTDEVEYRTL